MECLVQMEVELTTDTPATTNPISQNKCILKTINKTQITFSFPMLPVEFLMDNTHRLDRYMEVLKMDQTIQQVQVHLEEKLDLLIKELRTQKYTNQQSK